MKNKVTVFILLCALAFSACEWGAPPKKELHDIYKDTLAYSYQLIQQQAAECGSKPDSNCSFVKIKYPVFKGQAALNDTIERKLLNIFAFDGKADTNLQALSKGFLKRYTDFKKSDPKSAMHYTMDTYAKVINQDTALVAIEYGGYTFQGGAHGASFTGFVNWDTHTKKNLALEDIIKAGSENALTKVAERIFRRNEKLSDTSSLSRDYFFKGDKFALNNNFSVTPFGLRFVYNQYEINPYAAGKTELVVPYKQIKDLIKPGSVASQFIKLNEGI